MDLSWAYLGRLGLILGADQGKELPVSDTAPLGKPRRLRFGVSGAVLRRLAADLVDFGAVSGPEVTPKRAKISSRRP